MWRIDRWLAFIEYWPECVRAGTVEKFYTQVRFRDKTRCARLLLNECGKPRPENSQEALRLSFNLSHSRELPLIAVAIDRAVGVDVEFIDNSVPAEEVAKRFFSVKEFAALAALPQSLKLAGFFSCWTRKEAYIKARGMELSMPLDSVDVSVVQGETVAFGRYQELLEHIRLEDRKSQHRHPLSCGRRSCWPRLESSSMELAI